MWDAGPMTDSSKRCARSGKARSFVKSINLRYRLEDVGFFMSFIGPEQQRMPWDKQWRQALTAHGKAKVEQVFWNTS